MKIVALIIILSISLQTTFADFTDIEYNWYRASISNLEKAGIVNGSDGKYHPNELITRAEILKIIMGASQAPLAKDQSRCFPDVDPAMWYGSYICTARKLGVAKGFDNGTFKPNETVTYLEALAFGFRAFGLTPAAVQGEKWYTAYQELADKNDILITSSYTLGTKLSRGKAAELIERIGKYRVSKASVNSLSLGCTVPGKALELKNTIIIDGTAREYNLSVPAGYTKDKAYNLVVAIHGRTNSNDMVQWYMGLQAKSGYGRNNRGGTAQTDTIVAYPAGITAKGGYSWSEAANVVFFDAILQQVSDSYCVDRDQVLIVGHSLGGWFANKLACVRWDVIHAMASVGGPGYAGNCTGPAASIIFQRVDDPLVSLSSGKYAEANRKAANLCANASTPVTVGPFSCKQWNDCTTGNPVTWCEGYGTLQNDPHGWPTAGGSVMLNWFRNLGDTKAAF